VYKSARHKSLGCGAAGIGMLFMQYRPATNPRSVFVPCDVSSQYLQYCQSTQDRLRRDIIPEEKRGRRWKGVFVGDGHSGTVEDLQLFRGQLQSRSMFADDGELWQITPTAVVPPATGPRRRSRCRGQGTRRSNLTIVRSWRRNEHVYQLTLLRCRP